MNITKRHLRKLIKEEISHVLGEEEGGDIKQQFAARRKKMDILAKANEIVDFAGFEKEIDDATDNLEAAILALEEPIMKGDKEALAQARENVLGARKRFRAAILQTSAVVFKLFMTVKQLGGTLSPDEEKMLQNAFVELKKKEDHRAQLAQMKGGFVPDKT